MVPDDGVAGGEVSAGHLLDNLVLFGRLLREFGFDISSSRMITAVQALEYVNIGQKSDFYYALQCLLVRKQEEIPLFDQAFAVFWKRPGTARTSLNLSQSRRSAKRQRVSSSLTAKSTITADSLSKNPTDDVEDNIEAQSTKSYSQREILRRKDFAEMDAEDMGGVIRRLASIIWLLGFRKTRRKIHGRGLVLDFRRSLRNSLRYGGELLVWSRRKPKLKPRSLVIIADISGSMEQYTRMLLHFAYFVTRGYQRSAEVFVFSTRLTRITKQLRNRSIDQALHEVGESVFDWSGGTRMGEAIKDFNYTWARRLLNRGAVVLMISDGWDRGDPELLQREMARLQRSTHRLIWLNPLLGSPRYEPLTRGMQAALPFIDDFMPIHNLASLEELADHLARLNERPTSGRNHFKSHLRQPAGDVSAVVIDNA
jgi:uncharacterized protein with von Willebrand factor type A (vWA) domain